MLDTFFHPEQFMVHEIGVVSTVGATKERKTNNYIFVHSYGRYRNKYQAAISSCSCSSIEEVDDKLLLTNVSIPKQ